MVNSKLYEGFENLNTFMREIWAYIKYFPTSRDILVWDMRYTYIVIYYSFANAGGICKCEDRKLNFQIQRVALTNYRK